MELMQPLASPRMDQINSNCKFLRLQMYWKQNEDKSLINMIHQYTCRFNFLSDFFVSIFTLRLSIPA